MKNVQIIDGAINCVYDIFSMTEDEFRVIFIENSNIAFIEDIYERENPELLDSIFDKIWKRRLKKEDVIGVHGIIFYELAAKKIYYPTLRDEDAINPDGTLLR